MALPIGFTNAAAAYQDALRGKFIGQDGDVHPPVDQIAHQPPSTVNMLHVGRRSGASFQTILEENPDFESQGSTETVAEMTTELLLPPPFHGDTIFNISVDSHPRNGEIEEERVACENQKINRANENALAMAEQ